MSNRYRLFEGRGKINSTTYYIVSVNKILLLHLALNDKTFIIIFIVGTTQCGKMYSCDNYYLRVCASEGTINLLDRDSVLDV